MKSKPLSHYWKLQESEVIQLSSALGTNDASSVVVLTDIDTIIFTVEGLTAGTVTLQYSPDYKESDTAAASWYSIDETNLKFDSASGRAIGQWGCSHVRALAASASGLPEVYIAGRYVHELEA